MSSAEITYVEPKLDLLRNGDWSRKEQNTKLDVNAVRRFGCWLEYEETGFEEWYRILVND